MFLQHSRKFITDSLQVVVRDIPAITIVAGGKKPLKKAPSTIKPPTATGNTPSTNPKQPKQPGTQPGPIPALPPSNKPQPTVTATQPPATETAGNRVLLIRPARWGVAELAAPFTTKRILDHIRDLCSLPQKGWAIRIFPTEAAWNKNQYFRVDYKVEQSAEAGKTFENHFQSQIAQDGRVYVYKELVSCRGTFEVMASSVLTFVIERIYSR